MSLCEVVIELADAVAEARQPLTSREERWIEQIRRIGHFHDIRRLDLWEEEVGSVAPRRILTATEELLAEIEMLGRCNLYQAFQVERTCRYYARLVPLFAERGVKIPEAPDLSDW